MITLLSKIFIKNSKDYKNEKVRTAYGVLCGAVGIFLNICLFAIKFIAGSLSGSVAITADAFNNLSDAGSSVITLIGFKMASQEPDPDHPFGHGRFEYLSGLLVSIIIIIMAYELFTESVGKIVHPEKTEISLVVILILVISVLIKVYMAFYNNSVGKKIDSSSLKATGKDSLCDTISTIVVLSSIIFTHFTGIIIDGYCGILVSLFVLYAGVSAAKDTIGPLLGQPPEPEFVDRIEQIVLSEEHKSLGIIGLHDLIVHDYGPGRIMISLHAEVPSDGNVMELHDLIDNIEYDLHSELRCHAIIHMDPVCVGDPETDELKNLVLEAIEKLNCMNGNQDVSFHDFRLVKGPTHTNLIFDIVLPFKYPLSEDEVLEYIQKHIKDRKDNVYCVANFDRAYYK